MATRKRTATEADVAPAKSKKPANSAQAAEVVSGKAPKTAPKAKSAAATHKAPAKRSTKKSTAVPLFDAELHRDEIATEAYYLWLNRGCGHGQEHEDWLQATEIVRARSGHSTA